MDNGANLTNVHKTRKQVETDVQLLKNRIRLLQTEESKTNRRIEETRKRTKELVKLQKDHAEKNKTEMFIREKRASEQEGLRAKILRTREERKRSRSIAIENLNMSKREEARQVKLKSVENTEKANKYLQNLHNYNIYKINLVKDSITSGNQRIEKLKVKRCAEVRTDSLRRAEREEQILAQKEKEVRDMEQLEMELIKRLQNTQQIQKETYGDLEKALTKKINRFH